MSDEEFGKERDLLARWYQATGDVVRVVRARMRQLEGAASAPEGRLLEHPDLAALDLFLENFYGGGDGLPGASPG
ncbi:hypothetical protein EDD29_1778 [Actinocorallia herbida]|uniref:Uncharacterized protein n=1 Tax=Actinocorallia herbida TaxID=58109 RepID=A0A3N1CU86_9ACTN|nr:hypothetical protein [Actinocorallia herbida]ROO84258.1 hypothetical protein EDD29_1778 [Actinocorallia herbida]